MYPVFCRPNILRGDSFSPSTSRPMSCFIMTAAALSPFAGSLCSDPWRCLLPFSSPWVLSRFSSWSVEPLNLHEEVDFLWEGDNYPHREGEPSCFLRSSVNPSVVKSDWEPAHWAGRAKRLPAVLTQSSIPRFRPPQLGPGRWGALEAGLPSMPASRWAEPCVPFLGASSPSTPLFSSPRTGPSPSMAHLSPSCLIVPLLSDRCSDSSFPAGFPDSQQSGRGSQLEENSPLQQPF